MSSRNLWNYQLELQIRITRSFNLKYFHALREFQKARSVLEIGSGNGSFLSGLARNFPEKKFHGLDRSKELTRFASLRALGLTNLTFNVSDVYEQPPGGKKFDFIIARLIVQHLPDVQGFLKVASGLLNCGGRLLIIEAQDDEIGLEPEVPAVQGLIARIRKTQPLGGPAKAIRSLKRNAKQAELTLLRDEVLQHVVTGSSKATVSHLWNNVALLFEAKTPRDPKLAKELAKWQRQAGSRALFGYRHVLFSSDRSWWHDLIPSRRH